MSEVDQGPLREEIAEDHDFSDEMGSLKQQVAVCRELATERARKLRELTLEMVGAEERERQRIAGILHGDLQQVLFGARLQLHFALTEDCPLTILKNLDRLLKQAIAMSRNLSHRLDPPELNRLGLASALKWLIREYQEKFGVTTSLKLNAPDLQDPLMKVFIFRAVEELLFNVVKHSGVKNADIAFSIVEGNLVLTVKDQGVGCCPENILSRIHGKGLGLIRLQERVRAMGGDLVIASSTGNGCICALTIPGSF